MINRPRFVHVFACAPVLAAMFLSASAPASERGRTVETRATATSPAVVAEGAIAALRAAGYAQIRKLELEGSVWEARVTDAQGRRIEICVDAASAAVASCRN